MAIALFGLTGFFSGLSLYQKISGQAVSGFTTVIIIVSLGFCIVMAALGIIAFYLAKIFDQTKQRPRFIIEDSISGATNCPLIRVEV